MNIYAISDLEGLYPQQVLPIYEEIKKEKENKKLIICGDVIDSTIAGKVIYKEEKFRTLKSNNIKTIYDIVTNPNIFLTFGNRDLNKMKVGPLSELKSISDASDASDNPIDQIDLINQFNNGELNLDFSTYQSFSKLRLDWVQKMSNWYPFWGGAISDKISYWKDDDCQPEGKFFERRFQKIFGADTSIGTMSAGYLLETVPLELGLYTKGNNDYNAFVVLAVFRALRILNADFKHKNKASLYSLKSF
jgi:predicted phosphodiesterase